MPRLAARLPIGLRLIPMMGFVSNAAFAAGLGESASVSGCSLLSSTFLAGFPAGFPIILPGFATIFAAGFGSGFDISFFWPLAYF